MDPSNTMEGELVDQVDQWPEVKLPDWSKCSVCHEFPTTDEAKFMPCLHVVCSANCLSSIVIKDLDFNSVKCTACDKKHLMTDTFMSAILLELQQKERLTEEANKIASESPTCTYCVRGGDAVCWCETCGDHLCASCKDYHGFTRRTQDHEVTAVSDRKAELQDISETSYTMCQLHGKPLSQFCTSCVSTMCDLCAGKRHDGHAIEPLKELADQTRASIKKNLKQISSLMPKLSEVEDVLLQKAKHILETQKKFLINEASAQLTSLLSALMRRELEQRKELTETVVHKVKELNLKRLKISSLLKQSKQFLEISNNLLEDASDWAIITNRQFYEAQMFNIVEASDQFENQSKVEAYIEKGFNFLMDKSVGHEAEKKIKNMAEITYAFNPKAPTEIKMMGSGLSNKTFSRSNSNHLNARAPANPNRRSNGSQQQSQNKLISKSSPVKSVGLEKSKSSEASGAVSNATGNNPNQRKIVNEVKSAKHNDMTKKLVINESSSAVQQHASLNDQLIIEPVDDDSEGMEEDLEVDGEQKLQEDNMIDILDDADYDEGGSDDDTEVTQSPPKQVKHPQRFVKKVNLDSSQTDDVDQRETTSKNGGNNTASEEESQNDAPHLTPESMKSPPKLQKASASRSVKPQSIDYENRSDAAPPVLHPSVNLSDQEAETADLEREIVSKDKRQQGMDEDLEIDGEQKLQEDNMTNLLDDADYDVGGSDVVEVTQSPPKQVKHPQRFVKKVNLDSSQTDDVDQRETTSENGGNKSASEDESQNDAPHLTPESMKSPPKLQKASASRSVKPQSIDYENRSDASPPVLHPSGDLSDQDAETSDLEREVVSKDKRQQRMDDESSNPMKSDSQESGTSGRTTRSGKTSGRHERNESPPPRKPGASTRQRGSAFKELSLSEVRSRSSPRLRSSTSSDLPSKREKKKKIYPEFVYEFSTKKIKIEKVAPTQAPTNAPSTEVRRGRKPGRGRKRHTFGGRKPNPMGSEECEDDSN